MRIAETFTSVQGEGFYQGMPGVFFIRFAGCGVHGCGLHPKWWRGGGGCDTDFSYKRTATPAELRAEWVEAWRSDAVSGWVCITGGEPCEQPVGLAELVRELSKAGAKINLQTSGTIPVPVDVHWLSVSPKNLIDTIVTDCDELKYVWRGQGKPELDAMVRRVNARHYYMMPFDHHVSGPNDEACRAACEKYGLPWKFTDQLHKRMGVR